MAETSSQIRQGAAWTLVAIVGERVLTLAVFVVLGRLLLPAEFGIVALATAIADVVMVLIRSGLSEAVIRTPDPTPRTLNTAFWLSVSVGAMLSALTFLGAGAIARVFGEPQLVLVVQVLSPVFLITATAIIHEARAMKAFDFRTVARRTLVAQAAGGVFAVTLALLGGGLWSLVAQRLVVATGEAVIVLVSFRWRPGCRVAWRDGLDLLRFGFAISLNNMLSRLNYRIFEIVVGRFLNPSAVGVFRLSSRTVELVGQLCVQPAMRVSFAAFSTDQHDSARLIETYLVLTRTVALVLLPTASFLALFSGDVVALLFGPNWAESAPIISILCGLLVLQLPVQFFGPLASVRGHTRTVLALTAVQFVIGVVTAVAVARYGLLATALGRLVPVLVIAPVTLALTQSLLHLPLRRTAGALALPGGAWLVFLVVLVACDALLRPVWSPLAATAAAGTLAGIAHAAVVLTFGPDIRAFLANRTTGLRRRSGRARTERPVASG